MTEDDVELTPLELALAEQRTHMREDWIRFAEAYVGPARFNKTEACRIAGIANPDKRGYAIIRIKHVRKYIALLQKDELATVRVQQASAVREAMAIAYSNITDVVDLDDDGSVTLKEKRLSELPRPVQSAIKRFEVDETITEAGDKKTTRRRFKVEMYDKLNALKLIIDNGLRDDDEDLTGDGDEEQWQGIEIITPEPPQLTKKESTPDERPGTREP